MAKIACPGCSKTYNVPDGTSAVATCKACGKRFRIGPKSSASESTVTKPATTKAAPKKQPASTPKPAAEVPIAVDDSFWDDALSEEMEVEEPAAEPVNPVVAAAMESAEIEVRQSQKKKVVWGFDWGKVGVGAGMFVVGGLVTVGLVVATGYLYYAPAGLAIVGFFTMLAGLMGEEGIW